MQRIPTEEQKFLPSRHARDRAGATMQRIPMEEQKCLPAGAAMLLPRCTGEVRVVRFSLEENRMQSSNATELNRRSE
jgi:hypothetical protein